MREDRFILQHSSSIPDGWVLTDRDAGLVCRFLEGQFNETQKFTMLDDVKNPDPVALATTAREMAEWMAANHYAIAMVAPSDKKDIRSETRKRIGQILKDAREAKGLTVRALSSLTGIDKSQICRVEAGRLNVGIDTIAALAEALGLTLNLS